MALLKRDNRCCSNDIRHWSIKPEEVKEAFYEQQRTTEHDNLELLGKFYNAQCSDQEKLIQQLGERLTPFISSKELQSLLDPNFYVCGDNNEDIKVLPQPCTCKNIVPNDVNEFPIEEFYKILSSDRDNVIRGLVNRLKEYVGIDEINELLDANECCGVNTYDYKEFDTVFGYGYYIVKNGFNFIFDFFKTKIDECNIVVCRESSNTQNIFDHTKEPRNQTVCNDYGNQTKPCQLCHPEGNVLTKNEYECKSTETQTDNDDLHAKMHKLTETVKNLQWEKQSLKAKLFDAKAYYEVNTYDYKEFDYSLSDGYSIFKNVFNFICDYLTNKSDECNIDVCRKSSNTQNIYDHMEEPRNQIVCNVYGNQTTKPCQLCHPEGHVLTTNEYECKLMEILTDNDDCHAKIQQLMKIIKNLQQENQSKEVEIKKHFC